MRPGRLGPASFGGAFVLYLEYEIERRMSVVGKLVYYIIFIAKSSDCVYFTIHVYPCFFFFLNKSELILWESPDLCRLKTNYGYSSARPLPFPVYGVMEKGHVPFLCFLLYNIKMYPVLSKEPQGLRLQPNLVTSEIQRNGGQKTADL